MKNKFIQKEAPRTRSHTSRRSSKYRNSKGPAKYFAPYRLHKILDEVEMSDVEFDEQVIKSTLSPAIWEKDKLKQDVRNKLLKAAKLYYDYLDVAPVKLKDITITGSMANYNYHDLSDIDLHLILDYQDIDDNVELVSEFLSMKKAYWGIQHDIKIKGHDLEFYVQDADEAHHSTGVFSLVRDAWIVKPTRQDALRVNTAQIRKKSADLMNKIESIVDMAPSDKQIAAIKSMKKKIKTLRQAGLESDAQEFSVENLVFKVLRNTGYLEKLSDAKLTAIDSELSLDEAGALPGDINPVVAAAATVKNHAPTWRESPVLTKEKKEDSEKKSEKNKLMIQKGISGMTPEKIEIIKDFISFTRDKLQLKKPVKVGLRKGRDEYIRTTASYLPYENENYVRCEGRSLVDILRSIGHELCHNRQREMGIFNPGDNVQNIGGFIEDQANSIAGILIKDFAMNYGYDMIYDL